MINDLIVFAVLAVPAGGLAWYLRRHPDKGKARLDRAAAKLRGWFDAATSWLTADPAPAVEAPGRAAFTPGPRPAPPRQVPRPLPPPPDERARGAVLELGGLPADHALVHERIATFVAENDTALLDFYRAEARAALAAGEAWLAHVENLANELGLDPLFLQVAALVAEAQSDMAEMFAMIMQRFFQVYALVHQHLDEGGTLPFDGDFLTGEGS